MLVVSALVFAAMITQPPASTGTAGSVAGRVTVDGSNAPVAGAHVMLIPTGPPTRPIAAPAGMPPEATTDADGYFLFARIRPGSYRVDVQKTGFAPLNDPRMRTELPTAVEAGQTTTIDLHLKKGAVITGRILDGSGEPMPDVRVMAMQRLPAGRGGAAPRLVPAFGAGAQTNDIGEYRLSGLAAGEYYVIAMPAMRSPFGGPGIAAPTGSAKATIAATLYPGTTDESSAHPVTVAAGADVGNISFAMQSAPAFRVSGVVVDENGNPVAGARVMMTAASRTSMPMMSAADGADSQPDGRFTIGEVVAGTYRLVASVPVRFSSGDAPQSSAAAPGRGGFAGGYVSTGGSGGVSLTFDGNEPPTDVTVTDGDVSGLRVVARRPQP